MKASLIRAWKDPFYRASLAAEEAPPNPAGLVELNDEDLKQASGVASVIGTTCQCCTDTYRFRRCCP